MEGDGKVSVVVSEKGGEGFKGRMRGIRATE